MPDEAKVWVPPVWLFREVMPDPAAQDSQLTPTEAVEEATKQRPFAPTASPFHPVEEPTMRLPVEVAITPISFNCDG